MTKNQTTRYAKRKHQLQLRRNRKNQKTRLHAQLLAQHEAKKEKKELDR
tara:strand:- start:1 stop:147 length:147 start_codon:yes stop_codon:yes gene_type:complete